MANFLHRVHDLPVLGLGVSTEYGAARTAGGLDVRRLRTAHPRFARFLEVGVETAKGLDADARQWVADGGATTYHFLDVNLDEPEDLDPLWLDQVRALVDVVRPAWLCGDAGLWHFGRRERGHMLLLPPVLSDESARAMAEGIVRLREATGLEVLPENPPGSVYLGDLHLLDFFARVCDYADTGMLLDAAHLAIYQRSVGLPALAALDGFPTERIVEMHVAGGVEREAHGYRFVEDSHDTSVLPETWTLLAHVAARAPNLRAVVFECERNPLEDVVPGFERIASVLREHAIVAELA